MSSRFVAFAGPSLPNSARGKWKCVEWRPPAKAGDLLSLRGSDLRGVALIDGYFDHAPAPWHKEILVLLESGIPVYGAASMGALRAAELSRWGMKGVGVIHAAFQAGLLSGDDEVALVHANELFDWAPLSVPMVEVRATLIIAFRTGIIDRTTASTARKAAHRIYFQDRDWPSIRLAMTKAGVPDDVAQWLESNHVRLKQRDATLCVDRLVRHADNRPHRFETPQTVFLQRLQDFVDSSARSASSNSTSPASPLNG